MDSNEIAAGIPFVRKRVLVTGSAGFIGRYCVELLHDLGQEVLEIRNRIDCDLRDRDAVRRRLRGMNPDAVIHLAASPDPGHHDSLYLESTENTLGCTRNLLAGLRRERPCVFVHVGSYKQYGMTSIPFREDDEPRP